MKLALFTAAALVAMSAASPSYALFGDDEARKAILSLRNQVQSQQEAQLRMLNDLDALSREVRKLRGELDELKNSVNIEQRKTQQVIEGMNSSEKSKEDAAAAKRAAAQDQQILARQELDAAIKQVNAKKYDAAIKQLSTFLKKYGRGPLAPEAQYWLTSSYYIKGQTAKAIETGNRLANASPKHKRAPEALLIVGYAQLDLGKKAQAQAAFDRIVKDYPKSAAAKEAAALR